MLSLTGYQIIEQIHDDFRTQVYRGIRQSDGQPVAIKLYKSDYPSYWDLAKFRHQYTLAKNLNIPGIIKLYSLETYGNSFALIMEDFGGISLLKYTNNQFLPLDEFLSIALQIVKILEGLHHNCIIHKDIKPQNLLINPQTQEVKLIDFSISSLLPRETQEIQTLNILEGTLAYIAPEQTGRMNRGIDYRTDFYSLGVTFYELLTGKLPCLSTDLMEIVHCHIAKTPLSPIEINSTVPQVVNDIILKLMAKNAEDRYQNAYGIKYDLEICQQQWQSQGKILPFPIGQRDISDRFIIPEKLYGREREVKTMLKAFDRVASPKENTIARGQSEILLVAGFSGIGKTAVVNEVHKPIVRSRGYFIKGKFDQFNRNIPFSAFLQAFRDLMGQLLSQTDTQLEKWKTNILTAVGENGQVIIDVIPELEHIIGKQTSVSELSGSAAQNRFNLVFQKFIQVFTTPDHPLVIFFDDLQWADAASLKLIQLLMSEIKTGYLLLIGAYRDNEVSSAHPLILTLDEVGKTGVIVNTIRLAPLRQADLNYLVADTLSCSPDLAAPLTELVYQRTKGNPFFATQFLKVLHEEGWITFNSTLSYWQCDIAQIRSLALTDDVVEFMALQLQKLPQATLEVLKLAACIGNQFDLSTLAIVYEKSQAETASDLWKVLQEGWILPISEVYKFFQNQQPDDNTQNSKDLPIALGSCSYKFLHDRVQQAAYSLIPEPAKKVTHLKIGQLLLNSASESEKEEKIFDIVNHLNYAVNLLPERTQREELANLNLIAGRKAKVATAYNAAIIYLTVGIQLLESDRWETNYDLTLALYKEAAETAYLNTDYRLVEEMLPVIEETGNTNLICGLAIVKLYFCYLFGEFAKALEEAAIAEKYLDLLLATVYVPSFYFYYSLALLALYTEATPPEQTEILAKVTANQEKMKHWAHHAPMNYFHKFHLVEAERHRVLSEKIEAIEYYDLAIKGAKENGYIQEEALANEVAAKFYLAWSKEKIARTYLIDAYYCYARWGSSAKVEDLEKRYPQLLAPILNREENSLTPGNSIPSITCSSLERSDALDLTTVIKASQAIAGEVELNSLLVKLMKIVLENAGAQLSVLILNQEGKLLIEAVGMVDLEQLLVRKSIPAEKSDRLPLAIINYVFRTHEDVILTHASKQGNFINEPYIIANQTKSVMCTPILGKGKLIGILYLENNLITAGFTFKQTQLLKLLCSQAAISLENAQLYEAQKNYAQTLEHKVQELQQTETELRQSEERYRSLVIATSKMAWIWMTDAQGRAYDIPALREYTGQTIEEVSDWGWLEALHPDDRDRSAQIWIQAVATKSLYETEYRLRAADGSYRYFSARGVPILAEDGSIREWVGICADIHDRKQPEIDLQKANEELEFRVQERTAELQKALEQLQQEIVDRQQVEEALKISEVRFREIAHNLPGAIFQFSSRNGVWAVDYISEYIWELAGITATEMMQNLDCFLERIHPEDFSGYIASINEVMVNPRVWQYEGRLIKPSGEIRWWQGVSTPIFYHTNEIVFCGVLLDITARKQAELALRESEERYRRIIETTYEGIWMIDAQGNTSFINARMAQMMGYTFEEMLGKHLFAFMDEEGIALATNNLERRRQDISESHDFKFRRKDGSELWAILATTSIIDRAGQYIGALAMVTDISDRKQAEANLQKALASADAASRAKSEFLSKMSHELRTPLNAILGFSQILNRDVSLSAQQQEYLGIINRAGEHLLTLINDVLEMSKIEAGRIELHEQTFDLYNLLNSLEEMFQLKASSKGLQLIFNISQDIPQYIKTDESKLRQVLINLIGNAIKFTQTGNVTLRIKAAIANKSDSFNPLLLISNSQLYFEIEDTGPGISPEEIDTLFEAFVQTAAGKQSQSGTGLGLPISRHFVQLMGGEIAVSSILTLGSIFKFNIQISLPKDSEIPKLTVTQRAITLEPNQPNYRILVVEDQLENRLLLINLLSQIGFEVCQAVNGQEAVTLAESWQPHLIWMDIQMPIMNGYEATKRIRSLPKLHPIIIALTANAFAEDKANILAIGCDDFVTKPFREAVILEKMAHYLGVCYVYEKPLTQKQEKPQTKTIFPSLNNSESFPPISVEANAQLYDAAKALDEEKLGQLIEQLREFHPILYNTLAELLKQLRFDKIIELLEKLKND